MPVLFCIIAAALFFCLVILSPVESLISCSFIACGIPVRWPGSRRPRTGNGSLAVCRPMTHLLQAPHGGLRTNPRPRLSISCSEHCVVLRSNVTISSGSLPCLSSCPGILQVRNPWLASTVHSTTAEA